MTLIISGTANPKGKGAMDEFPDWIDLIALGPLLIQAAFCFWAVPVRRRKPIPRADESLL
jgi:hypothetical protein